MITIKLLFMLELIIKSYIALLSIDDISFRIKNQDLYIALRNKICDETGKGCEEVQVYYEAIAADLY